MSRRNAAQATLSVASLLCISRLLGFVRSQAMAALFGATGETDAFVVATSVITLATSVTGPITVTFMPVYAALTARGERDTASQVASQVMTMSLVFMMLACVLIFIQAPFLTKLIAPGFQDQTYLKAISLTRLMAPTMVLPLMAALAKIMLNVRGQFAAPALADVLENLVVVFFMFHLAPTLGIEAMGVSMGLGFLMLFLLQYSLLKKMEVWPSLELGLGASTRRVLSLAFPFMGGSVFAAVHHFVDKALASRLPEGSVAVLNYAERIRSLPMGILVASVATVVSPTLSGMWGKGDHKEFYSTVVMTLRSIGYFCVPAAMGLMVMAVPIVRLAFQRGIFTHQATLATAQALIAYAPGLVAGSALRIITMSLTSAQNTKAAVFLGTISSITNTIFDLVLVGPLGYIGLALAHSISAYVALACGLILLSSKSIGKRYQMRLGQMVPALGKILVASTIMAGVGFRLSSKIGLLTGTGDTIKDAMLLILVTIVSVIVYFLSTVVLKCNELETLSRLFLNK